MCKQRKLNYLKLHIRSTKRKRCSPAAVDNIIRDFVFCPNAAISLYATTRSQIPTTHVSQNTVFEALNIRRSLQLLGDGALPLDPAGDFRSQTPCLCLVPPMSGINRRRCTGHRANAERRASRTNHQRHGVSAAKTSSTIYVSCQLERLGDI